MSTSQRSHSFPPLPRRTVLRAAAASGLAILGWETAFRIPAAAAAADDSPSGVDCYVQAYANWSGEIQAEDVVTYAPSTVDQAVSVVNWAAGQGLRVRPVGMRHGWSPLTITNGGGSDCVLLDLTGLTAATVSQDAYGYVVTAQTGIAMQDLLAFLESQGFGLAACPAPGDLTLGGVLAIDGHGTAVPVSGQSSVPGQTFGSVSNLVTELTAIVWDADQQAYVTRDFYRSAPEAAALLVHLGRALIVSATLRIGANQRLRCVSRTDVTADTLFAPPAKAGAESFAAFVESTGRVETIWFPYTEAPWLKVWSVEPTQPATSRETDSPFNYVFSDIIPEVVSDLLKLVQDGATLLTPLLCTTEAEIAAAGLVATDSADLWGWSKNTLLYVRPTTLRVTANGYAILTTRENIQQVVSTVYAYVKSTLAEYQETGRFPINGPWEVRVTGLDDPADCQVPQAQEPILSALRPRPDRPFDTAVWFDLLTFPGTPDAPEFYEEFEQFLLSEFDGTDAMVRPEWSKGWAYTGAGAWTNGNIMGTTVPAAVSAGQAAGNDWQAALTTLNALDPHAVYSNAFLAELMDQ